MEETTATFTFNGEKFIEIDTDIYEFCRKHLTEKKIIGTKELCDSTPTWKTLLKCYINNKQPNIKKHLTKGNSSVQILTNSDN